MLYNIINYLKLLKESEMRAGFWGIMMGISMAIGLRNGKSLSSQVVTMSLMSEMMTIVILGVGELS